MPIFKGKLESMDEAEQELILTYDKQLYKTPVQALSKIVKDKDLINKMASVRSMESGHGKWAQYAIPYDMID
eukprot:gene19319-6474_t